jgi:hypothetical protein
MMRLLRASSGNNIPRLHQAPNLPNQGYRVQLYPSFLYPSFLEGGARRLKMSLYKSLHAAIGFVAVTYGHCRPVCPRSSAPLSFPSIFL